MDKLITERARDWSENLCVAREARQEIKNLLEENKQSELIDRFYKDIEFGTGGMRGKMGAGLNRINSYTVCKAVQGVSEEILSDKKHSRKVVISYDSRILSKELAMESAEVFADGGIQSYIFERPSPVSLLSFGIRYHKACAGIMITASHNPPEYNGLKVFWCDGAQVTPPFDHNITARYKSIVNFSSTKKIPFDQRVSEGLIVWEKTIVEDEYFRRVLSKTIHPNLCRERGGELKIVYTALHGTGLHYCRRMLREMGLNNFETVQEQDSPDGRFPTVVSPNPEDPKALKMAVDLMKKNQADMALGTDPDTDRVGICLRNGEETFFLNGNQIGTLMLHYILSYRTEQKTMPENPYFVKTLVTTPLQEIIAKYFGVAVENTLTGFKWICRRIHEIEKRQPHRNFIFATEESFGYLNHNFVRDKDGVSALGLLCEMGLYYKIKGQTLLDVLDAIYEEFGFFGESLLSFTYQDKEGQEKIICIMEHFRKIRGRLFGRNIVGRQDYLKGEEGFPKSNVLGLSFENGDALYLRPSGTEPKIKFYFIVRELTGTLREKKTKAQEKMDRLSSLLHSTVEGL